MLSSEDVKLVEELTGLYSTDVEESRWGLPPRMALRLYAHARTIAALAAEDPMYLTEDASILPPVAVRQATPAFLARFARCFDDLADRLADGDQSSAFLPLCTADEVALDHVLEVARDAHADGSERDWLGEILDALPESAEADDDFEMCSDLLFEDRDFQFLWQPEMDGIEVDEDMINQFDLANLRPDQWFLPFRSDPDE